MMDILEIPGPSLYMYSGDSGVPLAGVPPRDSITAAADIGRWQGGNTAAAAR